MKFVVFEAGSRAGFSAEMFFLDYVKKSGNKNDILYMVDDSLQVNNVESCENVRRITLKEFLDLDKKGFVIFPADELTRQSNPVVNGIANENEISKVKSSYYNKENTNLKLELLTYGCRIKIPKTFAFDKVCVRPNSMSAGSKGLQLLDNVSITEKINIVEEYVVDVLRCDDYMRLYPRAVVLKNGYDRLVKPLREDSEIGVAAREFILEAQPDNKGLFSNIFHLQLAKDDLGDLYYIESSKRISGTSIVNLSRGMNPFCFIMGMQIYEETSTFQYDKWYRYEDFIKVLDI